MTVNIDPRLCKKAKTGEMGHVEALQGHGAAECDAPVCDAAATGGPEPGHRGGQANLPFRKLPDPPLAHRYPPALAATD